MDKEQCLSLIQLYGINRLLWDSKCPEYSNKQLRDDAWRNISREINIPEEVIKKKMESLQGSYRREKSREKNSNITGSGRADIYKSKWYAYEAFSFMADKNEPGTTRDAGCEQSESQREVQNDNNKDTQDEPPANEGRNEAIQTTEELEQQQIPQKKKKKKNPTKKDELTDSCISEAFTLLQRCADDTNASQSANDAYSAFGHFIAQELRKYDNYTLAYIKHSICRIIFEADTGAYHQYQGYYPQPQTTPYSYCSTPQTLLSALPMHSSMPSTSTMRPSPMPSTSTMPPPPPMPSTSPMRPSPMPSTSPLPPHSPPPENERHIILKN